MRFLWVQDCATESSCGKNPACAILRTNMVTIEVQIDNGRVTPIEPHSLPEHGRGLLTVLDGRAGNGTRAFSVETEADGLPVIRARGGIITSVLVREIEGFAA
jgi:hypothetical protein